MGGYARAIGITTRVTIELWALRDGLNMCIELNLLTVDYRVGCKIGCGSLKETGWEFKWELCDCGRLQGEPEENTKNYYQTLL